MLKDVIFCKNGKIAKFYTRKKMASLDCISFIIGINISIAKNEIALSETDKAKFS